MRLSVPFYSSAVTGQPTSELGDCWSSRAFFPRLLVICSVAPTPGVLIRWKTGVYVPIAVYLSLSFVWCCMTRYFLFLFLFAWRIWCWCMPAILFASYTLHIVLARLLHRNAYSQLNICMLSALSLHAYRHTYWTNLMWTVIVSLKQNGCKIISFVELQVCDTEVVLQMINTQLYLMIKCLLLWYNQYFFRFMVDKIIVSFLTLFNHLHFLSLPCFLINFSRRSSFWFQFDA